MSFSSSFLAEVVAYYRRNHRPIELKIVKKNHRAQRRGRLAYPSNTSPTNAA